MSALSSDEGCPCACRTGRPRVRPRSRHEPGVPHLSVRPTRNVCSIETPAAVGRASPCPRRCALQAESVKLAAAHMSQCACVFVRVPWNSGRLRGSCGDGSSLEVPLRPVYAGVPGYWLKASLPDTAPPPYTLEMVAEADLMSPRPPPLNAQFALPGYGCYQISHACSSSSSLSPEPKPAFCLVSDLDGTMVGSDDGGTAQLRDFWTEAAIPRGSLLVYNTGRSMFLYEKLLCEKGAHMAVPDVLITGVGTRIHHVVDGQYIEDEEWTANLDENWSLDAAKAGVSNAITSLGASSKLKYRPEFDQNMHKVTIEMHVDEMNTVLECVNSSMSAAAAAANIITSWHGDIRVLDILPKNGGKRNAMEYVQRKYGFTDDVTIAAGDSGNDVLMLAGTTRGIVVGNAMADLRAWLESELPTIQLVADAERAPLRVYVASASEARGVLEGLNAMGFGK